MENIAATKMAKYVEAVLEMAYAAKMAKINERNGNQSICKALVRRPSCERPAARGEQAIGIKSIITHDSRSRGGTYIRAFVALAFSSKSSGKSASIRGDRSIPEKCARWRAVALKLARRRQITIHGCCGMLILIEWRRRRSSRR